MYRSLQHKDNRGWDTTVCFNDHAYINVFDAGAFEERTTLCLNGELLFEAPKLNEGTKVKIVLFPAEFWSKPQHGVQEGEPIGNFELMKDNIGNSKGMTLYFRISTPVKSHDIIMKSLSGGKLGEFSVAGSEMNRRKGKIYQFEYRSDPIEV